VAISTDYGSYGGFHNTGQSSLSAAEPDCHARIRSYGGVHASMWFINNVYYCFGSGMTSPSWTLYWVPYSGESYLYSYSRRRLSEDGSAQMVVSEIPTTYNADDLSADQAELVAQIAAAVAEVQA
jgi:hypothetical protein